MTNTEMKEHLLKLILEGDSNLRSPYGLYGHPPMWDLFTLDGVTTAIRPATVQERQGFQWVEVSGICWGRHRDGEWLPGEQHRSATFDWFIDREFEPALEMGAELCDLPPLEGGAPSP